MCCALMSVAFGLSSMCLVLSNSTNNTIHCTHAVFPHRKKKLINIWTQHTVQSEYPIKGFVERKNRKLEKNMCVTFSYKIDDVAQSPCWIDALFSRNCFSFWSECGIFQTMRLYSVFDCWRYLNPFADYTQTIKKWLQVVRFEKKNNHLKTQLTDRLYLYTYKVSAEASWSRSVSNCIIFLCWHTAALTFMEDFFFLLSSL